MTDTTFNQKIPARRPLSDADYTERGRRLTVRRAEDHRRAKERLKESGAVKFQTYVPAEHEELIRSLVADLRALLNEGASPRQVLSWRKTAAAKVAIARAIESHVACQVRDDHSHDRPSHPDETADYSASRQEQGLHARRRAQWRRAAARKRAAGLKRVALVVPRALKPSIEVFLVQILSGSSEALLPALEVSASVSAGAIDPGEGETKAEDTTVASLTSTPLAMVVRGAPEKPTGTDPTRPVGEVSALQVASSVSLRALAPQPDEV